MLKHYFIFLIVMLNQVCYAQEDSVQVIDEVTVSFTMKKEIAYEDGKYFIMDFHIDSTGNYLLLKNLRNYFVYTLNDDMRPEKSLQLAFRPRSFYQDCLGNLQIIAKDSMYQLANVDEGLFILDQTSIMTYHSFFQHCIGKTEGQLLMKDQENFGQTTEYYGLSRERQGRNVVYCVEDSLLVRSAIEENRLIANGGSSDFERMSETNVDQLREMRKRKARQDFFEQIVTKPAYNPMFIRRDTMYVFDHINGYRITLDQFGGVLEKVPIDYHLRRGWKKEIHLDDALEAFYAVEEKNGAQVFGLLSEVESKIVRQTKITKHAFPKKIIVFNGFAYYTYKERFEDNLNKLFRQRL